MSPPEDAATVPTRWMYAWLPMRLGEGMTGPLVPLLAISFTGVTAMHIGFMEAVFQALLVFGVFVWGRTSDDTAKRKAFILIGFLGSAVALAGMAMAGSFWSLFAWRGLKGLMAAAYMTAGGALVADHATEATIGENMGQMNMIGGLGYVGGLAVGAYIALFRATPDLFAVAALLTVVAVALGLAWIREPEAHLRRGEVHRLFQNVSHPFTIGVQRRVFDPTVWVDRPKLTNVERRAWAYLAAIFLAFTGSASGFVLFPLYLSNLGLSKTAILLLFVLNAALSALLARPAGRMADRLGYRPMQLGAIGARSGMFLLLAFPFATSVPAAVAFLVIAGVSWAVLNTTGPAALFRGMQIRRKGELVGLYTMAMGLGSLVGALLGGVLAQTMGYPFLFAVGAGLVAVSLGIVATVVYPPGGTEH